MSGFSYDSVETLDYDFTTVPKNTGKGFCKGKGTIPEPTEERIRAYGEAVRELFSIRKGESDAQTEKKISDGATERQGALMALTADLCGQKPSSAELEELPPRIRNAFFKWVYKEIADPEV